MCGWDDKIVKYFFFGNFFVYWGLIVGFGVFGFLIVWYIFCWQRGYREFFQFDIDQIYYVGIYFVIGWFFYYLFFVIMVCVIYVYYYYLVLYFVIFIFGFFIDWFICNQKKIIQYVIYVVFDVMVIGLYIYFIFICWGMIGFNRQYGYMKWFDMWRMLDV